MNDDDLAIAAMTKTGDDNDNHCPQPLTAPTDR